MVANRFAMGLLATAFVGAAHAANFVPAGGDLASQTPSDWNPEGFPSTTTGVSIPNAGTYWASANVTFNSLTFSATGETIVDQHAKGYDGVTVTAKGTTWALTQSANASVLRLKGGIWDFSGKHTMLGADGSNFSRCGIYIDDGAQVKLSDWRGSVHWSSSTQMLDHASSVTSSGKGYFIYDRQNKKYSQDNRFIVKGGSVFTSCGFDTYNASSVYTESHVSGNEMLVTGAGSKIEMSSGNFTIGNSVGEDFTVRLEDGGELKGGSGVTFGSSNNRLIVDGGKLTSKLSMAYMNNLVEIKNVTGMTVNLSTSSDPIEGSYNTLLVSNASVTTGTAYPFNSGSHNTMRVTGDATWTIGNEEFIDIARDVATVGNKLVIDDGGRVDVGFFRLSGDQNEVVISNGTLCANKVNNGFGITLGYYTTRTCTPVMRLQGTHPSVTKGDGKVVFVMNAGSELSFELPAEGYTDDPVVNMGWIDVLSGSKISVDCKAFQKAMSKAGVRAKTFTLMQVTDGMQIDSAVLAAANANIVADYPGRCRIYTEGKALKLEVKALPRGLVITIR